MSAYAALVSVLRILETIHDSGGRRIMHIRPQLRSLYEKATLLLDFLEFSITACKGGRTSALVEKMKSSAYAAEDALKLQMSRILHPPTTMQPRYHRTIENYFLDYAIIVISSNLASYHSNMVYMLVLSTAIAAVYSYVDDYYRKMQNKREIELFDRVLEDLKIVEEELAVISEAGGDPDVSADGALITLRQMLDSILDSGGRRISRYRAHLVALHDKVSSLMDFLRNDSTINISEREVMDAYIIRAAFKAKSLIRILVPNRFDQDLGWAMIRDDLQFWHYAIFPIRRSTASSICMLLSLLYRNNQLILTRRFPVWIHFLSHFFLMPAIAFAVLVLGVIGISLCTTVWRAIRNYKRLEIKDLPLVIDDFSIIKVRNVAMDVSGNPSELPAVSSSSSSTPSKGNLVGKDVVVGLASDMYEIKAGLLHHSSTSKFASIVGMGGIGKTTLARQVFKDSDIVPHFDVRAWVTVSQKYSFCHVLRSLLDSAHILLTEEKREGSEEELAECLHKHLSYRRYLIVIDDVWDTKILDFLSRYLPDNDNGSRVLTTSRLSRVATYPDSYSHSHDMRLLSDDDSWCLLRTKVFGDEGCPSELNPIGREIARRCQGLPLAILVVSGLLSWAKYQRSKWTDIAEKLNLSLRQNDKQCLEILGLSYNHLPHHLRPCFLYMGSFPRDCEIHVSTLFNLWTAEEFLKPCASKTSEEVAEDNLNDLIDRNLISVRRRSCNGKIRTCSIHGLLRDVSVQKASEENFLDVVASKRPIIESQRRVSMRVDGRPIRHCGRFVRSFLLTASELMHGYDASDHYLDLEYLRVLDLLAGVHFAEFPNQIIRLDHLKYLAFHCDASLPPSMWKLQNLETIVHQFCSSREYNLLPTEIWRMRNLRHLYVKPGCYLSNPAGYSLPWKSSVVLEHLQTLTGITNFKWSRGIIRRIPNLKKLGILYDVSSSVDWPMYRLESLVDLHQLESLKIIIKYNVDLGSKYNDDLRSKLYDDIEPVMSHDPPKLAFPQKLKKLSISSCRIPWESMTAIGALQNLEALKLKLEAFSGPLWVTVEGEFPRLMFLLLEEMRFTRWVTEESHFPRLQRLVIRSCGMLEKIPSAIGDIPTLEMIQLVDCRDSAVASAKEILKEQEKLGNDDLKLHIEWSHTN